MASAYSSDGNVPSEFFSETALYVTDLHSSVTHAFLHAMFSRYGKVLGVHLTRRPRTMHALSFAYVNFDNIENAAKAKDALQYRYIGWIPMRIMWSRRDADAVNERGLGNLFVKHLGEGVTTRMLHDTFAMFGDIRSCKVKMDRNGRSMCYGFVQYESPADAQRATEACKNMVLYGRRIFVGPWLPWKLHAPYSIYVNNMEGMTEEKLRQVFAPFGEIGNVAVREHRESLGRSLNIRLYGFVAFVANDAAQSAVNEMNNRYLDGRRIYVARAQRANDVVMHEEPRGYNVIVKELSEDVTDEILRAQFQRFGAVRSAKVMRGPDGRSMCVGFVCFVVRQSAIRAVCEMGNVAMMGNMSALAASAQPMEQIDAQNLTDIVVEDQLELDREFDVTYDAGDNGRGQAIVDEVNGKEQCQAVKNNAQVQVMDDANANAQGEAYGWNSAAQAQEIDRQIQGTHYYTYTGARLRGHNADAFDYVLRSVTGEQPRGAMLERPLPVAPVPDLYMMYPTPRNCPDWVPAPRRHRSFNTPSQRLRLIEFHSRRGAHRHFQETDENVAGAAVYHPPVERPRYECPFPVPPHRGGLCCNCPEGQHENEQPQQPMRKEGRHLKDKQESATQRNMNDSQFNQNRAKLMGESSGAMDQNVAGAYNWRLRSDVN